MNTVRDTAKAHPLPMAGGANTISDMPTATAAVRGALELLGRASDDWRNGGGCESGSLHWPVAVNLARRSLRQALEALESQRCPSEDTSAGITWFNSLTPTERRHWLEVADSAVPADAWRAFQSGAPAP